MVQIFSTFGLAIVMRGLAQYFFTPDYRSVHAFLAGGQNVSIAGVFLPEPQLVGALISIAAFVGLYFFINRTDFGRALEATREDAGAVALVGIDKNRVFALGWGLGAALVGLAGAVMAMFFYIYPDVGASFALIAYVTVALGGFGSVFGALCRRHHRRPRRGDHRAGSAALAQVGRHLRRLYCWSSSSGRAACSGHCDGYRVRRAPPARSDHCGLFAPLSPRWCRCSSGMSTSKHA